jgi:hypothetical protein
MFTRFPDKIPAPLAVGITRRKGYPVTLEGSLVTRYTERKEC